MQKCIVVSTPDAEFSALAFKEDFQDSIKKVADLGYDAVELAVRDPKSINIEQTRGILEENELPVPALGTGQAYGEEGLSFTDSNPEIREKAVQRIKDHLEFSAQIGQPQIIIGLIRGIVDNEEYLSQAEEHFVDCMQECADYDRDITLTLEPINRYETNLYNDLLSMKEVIDKIDRPNVKMLVDTFHMNIEEPDMVESIYEVQDYISHVHVADSNRWAPGCGHIDFSSILEALEDIGYDGAISAEILPEPDPDESARLAIRHMKELGL
ncbi:MAG: 5-keto-L-gluconate epimerase [Bacillota bacterium]